MVTSLGVYVLSIERANFYGLKVLQMTVTKYASSCRLSLHHRAEEESYLTVMLPNIDCNDLCQNSSRKSIFLIQNNERD